MSPHDGGTHLEWGVEGRGMRVLSQILCVESFIKTRFYGGALTSHFMEEHSSPTSMFPVFMMTSSNGNMFHVTSFCAGNSPVTAGNSPVTGEFPWHRPVTRSFDVFFDLRLNKRLSKQSRRRWFETPLRSFWRHCNVVPNSDPVIFRRSTRHSCPILNWWTMSNWGFPYIMGRMASKLALCSTLITIAWNYLYFALSGS